jgi:hypothetical protein
MGDGEGIRFDLEHEATGLWQPPPSDASPEASWGSAVRRLAVRYGLWVTSGGMPVPERLVPDHACSPGYTPWPGPGESFAAVEWEAQRRREDVTELFVLRFRQLWERADAAERGAYG